MAHGARALFDISGSGAGATLTYHVTGNTIIQRRGRPVRHRPHRRRAVGHRQHRDRAKSASAFSGFASQDPDSGQGLVDSCLDIQNNQLTGSGPSFGEIAVYDEYAQNTVRLPGYSGTARDITAVQSYLEGRNTMSTATVWAPASGSAYVDAGAACTQPPA